MASCTRNNARAQICLKWRSKGKHIYVKRHRWSMENDFADVWATILQIYGKWLWGGETVHGDLVPFTCRTSHEEWHHPALSDLGEMLGGHDFGDVRPNTKNRRTTLAGLLKKTDQDMRKSTVCMAPEGDSPTSLRLFEALAVGCLPIVMADKAHVSVHIVCS